MTENDNYDEMTTEELRNFYSRLKQGMRSLRRDPDRKEYEIEQYGAELERVRDVLARR